MLYQLILDSYALLLILCCMTPEDVLKEFEDAHALLKGHFVLSSGRHSDTYLQCARVLMDPKRADRLCAALTAKVQEHVQSIDMVVAPAMGGVVVGYEMARQLGVEGIFCERAEGTFQLRRGFAIPKGAKVLVVEDVVTTGKSSLEAFTCIKAQGGEVVAEASLVSRAGPGNNPLPVPLISLLEMEVVSYADDEVPAELAAIPVEKPGSRFLKTA